MDQPISVSQEAGNELVARTTFPQCECEPDVRHHRDGEPGEYRCGCGNELLVGPGVAADLSPAGDGTTGSLDTLAPWGEEVQVAWRVSRKE